MKVALVVLALALMGTAIVTSTLMNSPSLPFTHKYARFFVEGRVSGDFPDHPWVGTFAYLGAEKIALNKSGTFQFSRSPGTYILKICCSEKFRWIYREVTIIDRDVHLELRAEPLVTVPGSVIFYDDELRRDGLKISAWLLGTNILETAVTLSDGSFTLHLIEGKWQVNVENTPKGHKVEWTSFGGEKLNDGTFHLVGKATPSLPIQIALR
jgi:hypothetical protein